MPYSFYSINKARFAFVQKTIKLFLANVILIFLILTKPTPNKDEFAVLT